MNNEDTKVVDMMDVRLRRLHVGLDTSPDFDGRVFARVAELERTTGKAPANLREQFERRRARVLKRLRREAWLNGISACVLVLAGGALLLRFLPGLMQLLPPLPVAENNTATLITVLAMVAATAIGAMKASGARIRLR